MRRGNEKGEKGELQGRDEGRGPRGSVQEKYAQGSAGAHRDFIQTRNGRSERKMAHDLPGRAEIQKNIYRHYHPG